MGTVPACAGTQPSYLLCFTFPLYVILVSMTLSLHPFPCLSLLHLVFFSSPKVKSSYPWTR